MTDTLIVDVAVRAIGWAILHSIWQGAIIAALTALALRALRGRSANARYVVACLGLAALTLSWVITGAREASRAGQGGWEGDETQATSITQSAPPALPAPPDSPAASRSVSSLPVRSALHALPAWIVPLWLAGVLLLSARLACGWLVIERIRRRATTAVPDSWLTRADEIAKRLDIARPIRVVQSAAVHVPTVIGWLRPVVLLPASVFSGLLPAQLEAIIAHELAHVRRHDYAMNILQTAAEILLFYHPASWWISRQVRLEREHCCDDAAVAVCGNRYMYAEALADLEALRSDAPALALAATDGPLMRRVRRLVTPSATEASSPSWAVAVVPLTLLALAVISTNLIGMQAPGATAPQTSTPGATLIIRADEGAVQGRVVDGRSGRPVARASIELFGPERATTALTGDDGRFEVRGLEPAEYRVWARAQGYAPIQYGQRELNDRASVLMVRGGQITSGVEFRMHSIGAISGRILDERGQGVAGVEIELVAEGLAAGALRPMAFAQSEELGVYRFAEVLPGDYYVRAYVADSDSLRPTAAAQAARLALERLERRGSGKDAYGMTYYPSVTSAEQAQSLRVNAGQELFDIDVSLATVKTYRIAGTVIDPTGRPVGQTLVRIHPMGANRNGSERTASVAADGRFEILDVVPSDYMLNVFDKDALTPRQTPATAGPYRWTSASQFFTVDRDILGLELRASTGVRVEGRVVRDSGVTRLLDTTAVRLGFTRRVGPATMNFDNTAGADGTFSLQLPDGPVSVHVAGLPENWVVKSIRLDGVEIGTEAIDLGAGAGRRIEVVLTDRVSSVIGTAHDGNGRPVTNYSVVVFSEDSKMWSGDSRLVRETRTRQGGQFRVEGLPAGDYLGVAIESLPFMAWLDPQVLERLRPSASRFRLGEGQQATLSLRAMPSLDLVRR